jgi:hypothetical protein
MGSKYDIEGYLYTKKRTEEALKEITGRSIIDIKRMLTLEETGEIVFRPRLSGPTGGYAQDTKSRT